MWLEEIWGAGSFGGGLGGGALRIVSCGAADAYRLRIGFSVPIRLTKTYVNGDAARPGVFELLNGPPVAYVERPSEDDVTDSAHYADVVFAEPLDGYPTIYELRVVAAVYARDIVATLPTGSVLVPGVVEPPAAPSTDVLRPSRDLGEVDTTTGATLDASDDGDYADDGGIDALKTRIVRRACVRPGGFPWAPSYGLGLGSYIKRNPVGRTLINLASDAEVQIAKEPDVAASRVTLTRPSPGLLSVKIGVEVAGDPKPRAYAMTFRAT